ncbi:MAG: response regulator [Anaerolineales bacterium]|nr:response regulator [Anaerolineales bacterium]
MKRLTEPHPSIKGEGQRRDAKTFSGLILILFLVTLPGLFIAINFNIQNITLYIGTMLLVSYVGIYWFSRTAYAKIAKLFLLGIMWISIYFDFIYDPVSFLAPVWFTAILLISAAFYSLQTTGFFLFISILGILSLPLVNPMFPLTVIANSLPPLIVLGLLNLGVAYLGDQNRKQIQEKTTELENLLQESENEAAYREKRANALMNLLIATASLEFSNETPISERNDAYDALFLGVYMLGEEIQTRIAQLNSAKAEAEQANQAKTEFLSRMSHELRTPLNAILGFGQLLELSQKDPLTDRQRDRVHQIVKGGHHLLNLINEILDLSRIEANRLQISPEPVRIREALREACELAIPLADPRQITLAITDDPAEDVYVLADQQRLKQVLLNLLSNAVKYNKPGGHVSLTHEERPNMRLCLKVKDTGPGISAEMQAKLFTPFERLGAEGGGVDGTGLGLALSKRLVELMGGQIGVESTPGQGSTFWVELPMTDNPVKALRGKRETGELRGLAEMTFKILYIEDNLANYELVRQVLDEYPQVVVLGETRAEAGLAVAREQHPDLILLDLHLPGMKGLEALQWLKEGEETGHIPVVVLSADATPGRVRELLKMGAEAYMTKPLNVKEFIQFINGMISQNENRK